MVGTQRYFQESGVIEGLLGLKRCRSTLPSSIQFTRGALDLFLFGLGWKRMSPTDKQIQRPPAELSLHGDSVVERSPLAKYLVSGGSV